MIEITWLGHATVQFRLESGEVILMDPWVEGNPMYSNDHKIDRVDAILVSHAHFDHIHDVIPLAKNSSRRRWSRFSKRAPGLVPKASRTAAE